jgi:hypothetical protein
MKLKTICIIEVSGDELLALHSFSADKAGRREAKDLFTRIAKEQTFTSATSIPLYRQTEDICIFDDEAIATGWREGRLLNLDAPAESWCLMVKTTRGEARKQAASPRAMDGAKG